VEKNTKVYTNYVVGHRICANHVKQVLVNELDGR